MCTTSVSRIAIILFLALPGALTLNCTKAFAGGDSRPTSRLVHVRPDPPGAADFSRERERMVRRQIEHPRDGREPIRDSAVIHAMLVVPRHVFIPSDQQSNAYFDMPLPIGYDQTISQPYIVALMTELLELRPKSKVLEVGTGSGYQAAVLAHLTPHVYTVEIVKPLAKLAKKTLREQGYKEVKCRTGDGYHAWKEEAPFDAMIVTCAADEIPPPLWEQLKPGGRIVIPIGEASQMQQLVVVTKGDDGKRQEKTIIPVRFAPMTGKIQQK